MLLVHPVNELLRFIPVLLASVIAGTQSGNHLWSLAAVAVIIALALTRWFTTTYRITTDNVELRTGLIQRKKLSIPRNRVRSVDVEADLLHRALGLAVLSIGTGQQAERGDQFKLDSLDASLVPDLRTALLAHTRETTESPDAQPIPGTEGTPGALTGDGPTLVKSNGLPEPTPRPPVEIAHWQPNWVRYAPLSLTGFAIIAPIVGLAFQYGIAQVVFDSNAVQAVGHRGALVIALFVAVLIVALVVVVSLAACARYLATYHRLQVVDDGKTLHIRHGLFTTRQVTLDLARLRGATVNEPLLLRLAGAAELEAIMTGTDPRQKILPQAPRPAVDHTLAHLLDNHPDIDNTTLPTPPPITAPLTPHGPAAHRRRYTRALAPIATSAATLLALSLAGVHIPAWLWTLTLLAIPIAIALAWDRYRGLGHAVIPATPTTPTWLITRSGSLDRDRDCLEAPGIIGWTVRQTFWQRRAGVSTLIAATAAGKKRYHLIDLPLDQAWPLIDSVTPGLLGHRRSPAVTSAPAS
ncbi:PH domain-containing protein [Nocardia crassostreae]|uniref:PH domain-containing protein n=1 Tax=Nocardia crassostreae TaxID=53428 RepID=UPI000A06932A|nr:PH domain-containing protein [Nocardia crassostreae]